MSHQPATVITKTVPMYEEACASTVIKHLEAMRPAPFVTPGACNCMFVERQEALASHDCLPGCQCASLTRDHFAWCWTQTEPQGPQAPMADLVEQACGRFTRGKHKGQLRGWAHIKVVQVGGWKKHGPGYMNGRVVLPGQVLHVAIRDFAGKCLYEGGDSR